MYDVMEGVRVVEVAEHTFVPAAGMILADWGADVIKVERTTHGGDPGRHLKIPGADGKINLFFEAGNRGKRSIALDLTREEGRELLYRLVDEADVFVTNLRRGARVKLGIEPETLMARNPRLIYARGTGYGLKGKMADDGGFDFPSSWCRSGSAYATTFPGGEPPLQPGSVGDLCGGATLAGAISAALFKRERTGKGSVVDHSLYLMGIYIMSQSVIGSNTGMSRGPARTQAETAPLMNNYRTRDGRWLTICLLNESWWPDFAAHVGRPDFVTDPRFATHDARTQNALALVHELNAAFAQATYAEWCERLATMQGVWAPHQSPDEVACDPQALENGFVTPVRLDEETEYLAGASPAQFDERPIGPLRGGPGYGQHSADILRELGFDDEGVGRARDSGLIVG
ncbi:MAG: CoA transferase [Novosphingobium sp.]|nr:CoA transferase [Novosphingobium sp.]